MKLFKWLRKCPLLFLLLAGWMGLTAYTYSEGKLTYALTNNPAENPIFTALIDKNAGGNESDIPESILDELEQEDNVLLSGSGDGQDFLQSAELSNNAKNKDEGNQDAGLQKNDDKQPEDDAAPDSVTENDAKDSKNQNQDDNTVSGGQESDNNVGVTKYRKYKKTKTNSPYYSDPGKCALTTTYDYQKVDKSYFDDAVFIGDSRTVGMQDYSGLDNAVFFAKTGLNVYQVLDDEFVTDPESGEEVSVSYMLQHNQYGKIYFMIGINELGTGNTQTFQKAYARVLRKFREWQPDAVIYIQGIIAVSEARSTSDPIFNNININDKNVAISAFADGKNIFYFDINPLVTDKKGNLKAEYTFDDIHMYAQYYKRWTRFLLKHAVVR